MAAASPTMSVKLLTGEILSLELDARETYTGVYHLLWMHLPLDIRPDSIYQMNLMNGDELVPIGQEIAVLDLDIVYVLLLDPSGFLVSFGKESGVSGAVHENHQPHQPLYYTALHLSISQYKEGVTGEVDCTLDEWHLYDPETDRYTGLVNVATEWIEWRDESELAVEIPADKPVMNRSEMIEFLLQGVMDGFQPSLAGLRWIRMKLDAELDRLEETDGIQTARWAGHRYHEDQEDDEIGFHGRYHTQGTDDDWI